MTNEEAIKKLEWALKNNTIYDENEAFEYILALKMAIKALEQESCEDCISRTEVNKLIQSSHLNLGNLLDTEIMQARINSLLPYIQSTQKMGHWITTRTLIHDGEYYCDKCDHSSPDNKKWDYCPNCGAKMESEDKGMIEILDKIKVDIRKKMRFDSFNEGIVSYDDINKIFDKYKAEIEKKYAELKENEE